MTDTRESIDLIIEQLNRVIDSSTELCDVELTDSERAYRLQILFIEFMIRAHKTPNDDQKTPFEMVDWPASDA